MDYVLQFNAVFQHSDLILTGLINSVILSASAIVMGFILAIFCARIRTEGGKLSRGIVATYVELVRNTPFLAQLFLIAFGIPQFAAFCGLSFRFSPQSIAILALSLNLGAFVTEIIRAGLESIPRSQIEAAESLALTPGQIFFRIKLPPALLKVYPAMSSQFILQMLGTSIVSVIAVQELTATAGTIQAETFRAFETYIVTMVIYFCLAWLFRGCFSTLARYFLRWRPRFKRPESL